MFCYHKSGTVLFEHVMQAVAARLGLRLETMPGFVTGIDPAVDIVILEHALLGFTPARPFRGVRVLRDPRDIWLSGYLYHRRCDEAWCTSTDFDPTAPIAFPRVPIGFQHRRERWKRDYLAGLGGKSYQHNLLDRDRDAGLDFELDRYTAVTLEAMAGFARPPGVIDVQLETITRDYDATMAMIFRYLGFTEPEIAVALEIAAAEDVGRMDERHRRQPAHPFAQIVEMGRHPHPSPGRPLRGATAP